MIRSTLFSPRKRPHILRFVCALLLVVCVGSWNPAFATASSASNPIKMSLPRAKPLLFAAKAKHTATVIFLHGLGDTGFGWASAVESWVRRNRLEEVKFVLPHAPRMPITAAGGMSLPGWFDIAALTGRIDDIRANQDEKGMFQTRDYVNSLIQSEIDAGIPANRIVVGGFSQGGAMALLSGLTAKVKLAGIVSLSAWLPLDAKFPTLVQESDVNHDTPVFMAHGSVDTTVPTPLGQMSYEMLKKQNYAVTMKMYTGMAHSACEEELDDVENFLLSRLPKEDKKSEL
ncbi:acyl-protein thioesterase-1-like protein [Xylariaceae sp. FL0594]|nr:acyl-protein thioesterase-1-like protein [Xylariaceae sp. FL0594]